MGINPSGIPFFCAQANKLEGLQVGLTRWRHQICAKIKTERQTGVV